MKKGAASIGIIGSPDEPDLFISGATHDLALALIFQDIGVDYMLDFH